MGSNYAKDPENPKKKNKSVIPAVISIIAVISTVTSIVLAVLMIFFSADHQSQRRDDGEALSQVAQDTDESPAITLPIQAKEEIPSPVYFKNNVFRIDGSLLGSTYSELEKKLGVELPEPEKWEYWGKDLTWTYYDDFELPHVCFFFQKDKCCMIYNEQELLKNTEYLNDYYQNKNDCTTEYFNRISGINEQMDDINRSIGDRYAMFYYELGYYDDSTWFRQVYKVKNMIF